jgi:multidrug efflux pump subunit AcrB
MMRLGGPNQGMVNARLVPQNQRDRSAQEIMRAAREALSQIPARRSRSESDGLEQSATSRSRSRATRVSKSSISTRPS